MAQKVASDDYTVAIEHHLTVAAKIMNEPVNHGGPCATCGSVFPCERAILAENNLALGLANFDEP
jgi:hypothetical protein